MSDTCQDMGGIVNDVTQDAELESAVDVVG